MKQISLLLSVLCLSACQSAPHPPLTLVPQVDLQRFMGDWYVIASIPTFIEKGAHNAVESYRLDSDGSIATTFTFRKGAFHGKTKVYTPRGFVVPGTGNAVWGMRFVWPFKADYRIMYLDAEYSRTIIAREARDYVWIMARTPTIPEADYRQLTAMLEREGYDTGQLQRVPQRW